MPEIDNISLMLGLGRIARALEASNDLQEQSLAINREALARMPQPSLQAFHQTPKDFWMIMVNQSGEQKLESKWRVYKNGVAQGPIFDSYSGAALWMQFQQEHPEP